MATRSSEPGPFSTTVLSFNSGFVRLSVHGPQATFSGVGLTDQRRGTEGEAVPPSPSTSGKAL